MNAARWSVALMCGVLALPGVTAAQEIVLPWTDVLSIDATVTSEVAPDLAVVTLAIVREGADVAPLTRDVNETLARAFADAKTVTAVVASNGGYSTSPRYDSRGGKNTQNGWQVRAEIVLKSRDFVALGALVGRLSQSLQIASSGFEISPELHAREDMSLIERGARVFQDKAAAASKAFGYAGYSIRQVTVGNAGQTDIRPMKSMRMVMDGATAASAPLQIESGLVTLTLNVTGSLQMRR